MSFPNMTRMLERSLEYPTSDGAVVGFIATRDDLIGLLGECSKHVTASVIPTHYSADCTSLQITVGLTFSRAEIEEASNGSH